MTADYKCGDTIVFRAIQKPRYGSTNDIGYWAELTDQEERRFVGFMTKDELLSPALVEPSALSFYPENLAGLPSLTLALCHMWSRAEIVICKPVFNRLPAFEIRLKPASAWRGFVPSRKTLLMSSQAAEGLQQLRELKLLKQAATIMSLRLWRQLMQRAEAASHIGRTELAVGDGENFDEAVGARIMRVNAIFKGCEAGFMRSLYSDLTNFVQRHEGGMATQHGLYLAGPSGVRVDLTRRAPPPEPVVPRYG